MIIRPACLATDVPGIARVCQACEPADPVSLDTVYPWLKEGSPGRIQRRLVAVDERAAVTGYACVVHAAEAPAHHFYTWVGVDLRFRCRKIALALKVLAARYARQKGAREISTDNADEC
jgi:hypothetical protein